MKSKLLVLTAVLSCTVSVIAADTGNPAKEPAAAQPPIWVAILLLFLGAFATQLAKCFFDNLSLKKAFDIPTSMKAVFMDPNRPEVGWCEETVKFTRILGK